MSIKNKDFVELEYTGKLKEEDVVFDTTDEKIAKDSGMFNENTDYGPVIVCVGQEHVLKGIDKVLVGKDLGKFKVDLKPEDAFGGKDAKMIQLIPTSKFSQQKIRPMPGLQVNVDGIFGIIKTVSGGRTLVDFNHPLSGKELSYDVKINRIVNDDKEKIKGFLKLVFGIKDCEVSIENEVTKIKLKKEIDEKIRDKISEKLKEVIPNIKKLDFAIQK